MSKNRLPRGPSLMAILILVILLAGVILALYNAI